MRTPGVGALRRVSQSPFYEAVSALRNLPADGARLLGSPRRPEPAAGDLHDGHAYERRESVRSGDESAGGSRLTEVSSLSSQHPDIDMLTQCDSISVLDLAAHANGEPLSDEKQVRRTTRVLLIATSHPCVDWFGIRPLAAGRIRTNRLLSTSV